jgi:hypothetical protein
MHELSNETFGRCAVKASAEGDAASDIASDLLEEEADRRGRDGYDEPVFYRGEESGARRKYSDGLLLARLKALKPEHYREGVRSEVEQKITVRIRDFDPEDALKRLIGEKRLALDELPEDLRTRLAEEEKKD